MSDPSSGRRGHTQVTIDQESQPRLPHEHDESSDSQASDERRVIRQAHDDVVSGKRDTDRGVPMDDAYQRQKERPSTPTKRSRP